MNKLISYQMIRSLLNVLNVKIIHCTSNVNIIFATYDHLFSYVNPTHTTWSKSHKSYLLRKAYLLVRIIRVSSMFFRIQGFNLHLAMYSYRETTCCARSGNPATCCLIVHSINIRSVGCFSQQTLIVYDTTTTHYLSQRQIEVCRILHQCTSVWR